MKASIAANAFAIVVGVERSSVFADDPLLGPAQDAMLWCDRLVSWGLPRDRVQLFISAKPSTQAALAAWCAGSALPPEPSEAAIREFVLGELPKKAKAGDGASLIIVWSGHGVINQRDAQRTRRLYYSDSSPETGLVNLELVSFMQALRTARFAGFAQQSMLVDACANYSVGLANGARLSHPTDFISGQSAVSIRQRVLMAAAPGRITIAGGAIQLDSPLNFSRKLLNAAASSDAGHLPDLAAAYRVVRQAAESDGIRHVDWCDAEPDDRLPDVNVTLLRDTDTTALLAALRGVTDLGLLQDSFRAALRGIEATGTHLEAARGDVEAMALVLAEVIQTPSEPPAPMRWAAQVAARLGAPNYELELWLQRSPDAAGLLADYRRRAHIELQAGQARGRVCHLLVIEGPEVDAAGRSRLQGWLFLGDPMVCCELGDAATAQPVDRDGQGRASAMKALVDEALGRAQELGIERPDLIIQIALPHERLDEDIEAWPIGLRDRERPLGLRHPVVRRCADRIHALAHSRGRTDEILKWIGTAEELARRLGDHGLRIVWVTDEDLRSGRLDLCLGYALDRSCIGLQRSAPSPTLARHLKHAVFDDGVPFACWNDQAWSDADGESLWIGLAGARDASALHKLWRLRSHQDFAGHPVSSLRLVWDDPRHNPYDKKYKVTQR